MLTQIRLLLYEQEASKTFGRRQNQTFVVIVPLRDELQPSFKALEQNRGLFVLRIKIFQLGFTVFHITNSKLNDISKY